MGDGYSVENDVIIIKRELTALDSFVMDFLAILKKHGNYLVVSGFVSIATGRTRGTEDIDVLVLVMDKNTFNDLFEELIKNKFWCYQGDNAEEVFEYVKEMHHVRFARVNEMFPNIEFIPINETKKVQYYEFTHPQKIRVKNFEFNIPPLEFEILYKEKVLSGKKDIADARHLRTFFADIIKNERFIEYEKVIQSELI